MAEFKFKNFNGEVRLDLRESYCITDSGILREQFFKVLEKYEPVLKHMFEDMQIAYDEAIDEQYPMKCPKEGAFIGYKLAKTYVYDQIMFALVELSIPAEAKRSSAKTNKCRCSEAYVKSIKVLNNDRSLTDIEITEAFSDHDNDFIYRVGETVKADRFDDNRWNECSNGIHFYMDIKGATDHPMIL